MIDFRGHDVRGRLTGAAGGGTRHPQGRWIDRRLNKATAYP
jgi:hypothetical protein